MNKFKQMQQTVILVLLFLFGLFRADAQEAITLAKALTIAETGSPDLQLSLLNLERFQQNHFAPDRVWYPAAGLSYL